MDNIILQGLVFFGRHGVNPEETSLGQRFNVDIAMTLDLSRPARTDNLADTVSYSAVYKLVKAEVEGEPSKLLEHVAGRILEVVLRLDERVAEVRVKVTKPNPPLKASTAGEVAVEMTRRREWLESDLDKRPMRT